MKKHILKKWNDSNYLRDMQDLFERLTNNFTQKIITGVDISGIELSAVATPEILRLCSLYNSNITESNISYSKIELSMSDSTISRSLFSHSKIHTIFSNCNVELTDFTKSEFLSNLNDSIFTQCIFDNVKFKGRGLKEYGGRRTKFINCSFKNALFKRVEFRASQFINCSFEDTLFDHCDLRGTKFIGSFPTMEQLINFDKSYLPQFIIEKSQT